MNICQNEVLSEGRQLMNWVGMWGGGESFPVGSLIGGNFLDGNFPGGNFPRTVLP